MPIVTMANTKILPIVASISHWSMLYVYTSLIIHFLYHSQDVVMDTHTHMVRPYISTAM